MPFKFPGIVWHNSHKCVLLKFSILLKFSTRSLQIQQVAWQLMPMLLNSIATTYSHKRSKCSVMPMAGKARPQQLQTISLQFSTWHLSEPISIYYNIASFTGPRRGGERAWFPLFAHALNRSGIPPTLWMFDYVCTLVTSKYKRI